jgi:hypothetical protein
VKHAGGGEIDGPAAAGGDGVQLLALIAAA